MTTERRSRGRPPGVSIEKVAPSRAMTEEEAFLLQNSGRVQSVEGFRHQDSLPESHGVTIVHTRPGTVMMWKPGPDGHYTPRTVSESSRALNLQNGWAITCPECHTNHEASPYPPSDPNSCPSREPVAVRECPVCNKRVFDNVMGEAKKKPIPDPNVIKDEYEFTTPESRTRLLLNTHMWVRHPQQAQMRGLPPLPSATLAMPSTGTAGPL